jgi:hypothetical protein
LKREDGRGERGEGEERCGHNITSCPFASFKEEISGTYLNSNTERKKQGCENLSKWNFLHDEW